MTLGRSRVATELIVGQGHRLSLSLTVVPKLIQSLRTTLSLDPANLRLEPVAWVL